MNRVTLLTLAAACLIVTGCAKHVRTTTVSPSTNAAARSDLDTLVSYMTGSFSSAQQHVADPEAFFDIHLHMTPIWPQRTDGRWLYVEQAAADTPDKPYRQRIYRVSQQPDGSLESAVYTIKGDPLRLVGWWKTPKLFAGMTPADLDPRSGCSLILRRDDQGRFVGETQAHDCPSERAGAAYATSEAVIRADGMTTWDRGYDAAGKQVWGATKGGYEFRKIAD